MQKIKIGCIAIGVWALLVSLAELLPALDQSFWWAIRFGRVPLSEVATESGWFSMLSFHGLPAALAFPLFLAIGLLTLSVARIISRLQDSQRRRRGDLTKEEIDQIVQARKRQAEKKQIAKKVADIIEAYGSLGTYRNDSLELSMLDKSVTVKIPSGADWNLVFGAQFVPARFDKTERTFLRPDPESGRFELVKDVDYSNSPAHYVIQSYIPGEWEQAIENLYFSGRYDPPSNTKGTREPESRAAKRTLLEEERKRFGI